MIIDFLDEKRDRKIPSCIYLPKKRDSFSVVIFNSGYQSQEQLANPKEKLGCMDYEYLANFFNEKGFAFVSIQHEILGDSDGLETVDSNKPQNDARKHLYERGARNIFFVLDTLKSKFPNFKLNKFVLSGHSNGGDIAKFFANKHSHLISCLILFDARRCFIAPRVNLKILMFESYDTSADVGVIPDEGTREYPKRENLEWVIVKPKDATHRGYRDTYIKSKTKKTVFSSIEWFMTEFV
ncbi:MAG: hypothetical protein HRU36_05990 [Rickettsiales bacterium]|nr:hypothetical protein [Rickettsiales bacterium]